MEVLNEKKVTMYKGIAIQTKRLGQFAPNTPDIYDVRISTSERIKLFTGFNFNEVLSKVITVIDQKAWEPKRVTAKKVWCILNDNR